MGIKVKLFVLISAMTTLVLGQPSLQLSSAGAVAGSTVPLSLALAPGAGTQPAALEWNVLVGSGVTAVNATLGAAGLAAGKSLQCSGSRCLLYGMNSNTVSSGVVAILNITLSPTASGNISIQLGNLSAATAVGDAIAVSSQPGSISILPPVGVAINPSVATLSPSQTQQITATVTGRPGNTAVTWGLSPNVGTISNAGLYTAPVSVSTQQTVTVIATSVADPTKSATATITLLVPTAPTISWLAPANGASVGLGTITVTANASDNVEVTGVQFKLDGAKLGGLVTGTGPAYSAAWDTTTVSNGPHTLTAVLSDAAGNTGTSSITVTVTNALLLLHTDATELTALTNGSTVIPSIAPAGFTGTVVVNGTGSVNFAPAEVGNGVYFLNCCATNTNNAYYKFTGASVGNIFNVNQGQISFYLKSRYSFAQRVATATGQRYAFDVRDGSGTHLFNFMTQIASGRLMFVSLGSGTPYLVPQGSEDALFGNGVILKVTITWNASKNSFYLNDTLVASAPRTTPTPNWTAASTFDLGAREYLALGGNNSSDDVIDEFTVLGQPTMPPPLVAMMAPQNGSAVIGTTQISGNASSSVGIIGVQFTLDGVDLGPQVTGSGPAYTYSWNTLTVTNGAHIPGRRRH